jgi:hypothetical protein
MFLDAFHGFVSGLVIGGVEVGHHLYDGFEL